MLNARARVALGRKGSPFGLGEFAKNRDRWRNSQGFYRMAFYDVGAAGFPSADDLFKEMNVGGKGEKGAVNAKG